MSQLEGVQHNLFGYFWLFASQASGKSQPTLFDFLAMPQYLNHVRPDDTNNLLTTAGMLRGVKEVLRLTPGGLLFAGVPCAPWLRLNVYLYFGIFSVTYEPMLFQPCLPAWLAKVDLDIMPHPHAPCGDPWWFPWLRLNSYVVFDGNSWLYMPACRVISGVPLVQCGNILGARFCILAALSLVLGSPWLDTCWKKTFNRVTLVLGCKPNHISDLVFARLGKWGGAATNKPLHQLPLLGVAAADDRFFLQKVAGGPSMCFTWYECVGLVGLFPNRVPWPTSTISLWSQHIYVVQRPGPTWSAGHLSLATILCVNIPYSFMVSTRDFTCFNYMRMLVYTYTCMYMYMYRYAKTTSCIFTCE